MTLRGRCLFYLGHAVLAICWAAHCRSAVAQDPWEFTPYRIHLWVLFESSPQLPESLRRTIERQIVNRSDVVGGAPWDVIPSSPPPRLVADLTSRLEKMTPATFLASLAIKAPPAAKPAEESPPAEPNQSPNPSPKPVPEPDPALAELLDTAARLKEILRDDKLVVVVVRPSIGGGYEVVVREFDCRSRRWENSLRQTVPVAELISEAAISTLVKGFTPIAKLYNSKGKNADFKLRASGLVQNEDSPVITPQQAILRPFVRFNDRYGEPRAGGINPVAWTYVIVSERTGGKLKCAIESGMQAPLTGRSNPRTERFALLVRPPSQSTKLRLRTTEKPPQPMTGYNVYAKNPLADKSEKFEELGRTDWRGMIEIPPESFPLRIIYLRNGSQLLARLSVVPGIEAEQVVDLTSDDRRLQAEGFVSGVQNSLMDLMAQRELISTRFRKRLEEGKFADAQKLLNEFQALESRDDLNRLLDQQQGRITSPHKSVQAKINKMFDDTRKLVAKFVDPDLGNRLVNEMAAAKAGSPLPTQKKSPAPTTTPPAA